MKITLESTTKLVELNGVPARIWEGTTESGIAIHAYVVRVAVAAGENTAEFERELTECRPPRAPGLESLPLRLIL